MYVRTLLAKWLSVHFQTKWLWVWVLLQSLKEDDVIKLGGSDARMIMAVWWICNPILEDRASTVELKNKKQIDTMTKILQSRRLL